MLMDVVLNILYLCRQECVTVPRRECKTITRPKCITVEKPITTTVAEQKCFDRLEEVCITVPRQQCNTVQDKISKQVMKSSSLALPSVGFFHAAFSCFKK